MPLQDLTPQLRTRLSRLEFLVGLFVTVALALMLAGLGYYMYQRAARKGWFLLKLPYFTFVRNAEGLNVGDKVKLMGFAAGEILEITPMPPGEYYDVYVRFQIWEPYYGYLWDDSQARVVPEGLLGNRSIEVTKGTDGVPTYLFHPYQKVPVKQVTMLLPQGGIAIGQDLYDTNGLMIRASRPLTLDLLREIEALGTNTIWIIHTQEDTQEPTGMWSTSLRRYIPYDQKTKGYFLEPRESPALTERLETMVNLVQTNLPNVLRLTNQLAAVLTNAAQAATRANDVLATAQPLVTNLALISTQIRDPQGGLGNWLFPTNLNNHLTQTLAAADTTLVAARQFTTNTDAHLGTLATNLNTSLENLANLTSNLNAQVQANSNLVTSLDHAIVDLDSFVQGLKHHWLFRSAFKTKKEKDTNAPPVRLRSPRDRAHEE